MILTKFNAFRLAMLIPNRVMVWITFGVLICFIGAVLQSLSIGWQRSLVGYSSNDQGYSLIIYEALALLFGFAWLIVLIVWVIKIRAARRARRRAQADS